MEFHSYKTVLQSFWSKKKVYCNAQIGSIVIWQIKLLYLLCINIMEFPLVFLPYKKAFCCNLSICIYESPHLPTYLYFILVILVHVCTGRDNHLLSLSHSITMFALLPLCRDPAALLRVSHTQASHTCSHSSSINLTYPLMSVTVSYNDLQFHRGFGQRYACCLCFQELFQQSKNIGRVLIERLHFVFKDTQSH